MPGLLQPWWLIGLILVPIIRWLHRRQAPSSLHTVSAVFLWRSETPDDDRGHEPQPPDPAWRRRALIAALLIVALALPAIEREHRIVTVWLDSSASMQTIENGETRFDAAQRRLERELQDSTFDQTVKRSLTDTLPRQLDNDSAHWLITDGASEGIRKWALEAGIDRVIPVGIETENVAVTRLALRRNSEDSDNVDVLVSVGNTGNEEIERQLDLLQDEQAVRTTNVSLRSGQVFHWRTQIPAGNTTITAVVDANDALPDDDQLSIAGDVLRPLNASVDAGCGSALRAAIEVHPALVIAGEPDIEVSCPRETFAGIDAPTSRPIAKIRVLLADQVPVDANPVWMPINSQDVNLHLPAEFISAADWPVAIDADLHRVLLQSGDKPLVVATPSTDGKHATVETVIDMAKSDFTRQPEFAALVATLVDLATGRRLLDEVLAESRDLTEAVIRPGSIRVESDPSTEGLGMTTVRLDRLFLVLALLVLMIDVILRPSAARVAVLVVLGAAAFLPKQPAQEESEEDREPGISMTTTQLTVATATDTARPGQRIGVVVDYLPSVANADVLLVANDRPIARRKLPSSGRLHFQLDVPITGPLVLGAELRDRDSQALLTENRAAALVNVATNASVLVIANTPSTFADSLRQGGWDISEIRPDAIAGRPGLAASASMLVLDNIAATDLAPDSWAQIERAVRREAMGLLVLGGPRSFGLGGYRKSRLESMLPLVSEPPENEPAASVMFLVDVSGSMDRPSATGSRLQIAEQAVVATAKALRDIDHVGLMSFDVNAREHLPLTPRREHGAAIEQAWPGIASGGTQLVSALTLALDTLDQDANEHDILIILTDGKITPGEFDELNDTLRTSRVEVIALLVGADAADNKLLRLINENGGRALPVDDLLHLPSLMRKEIEQSRPAIVTGPAGVMAASPAPWLPVIDWPPIDRYMLTRARETAAVHLVSDHGDAIVASMNVGAGHVVAITSGFSNWTMDWLQSDDWPIVAGNLARRLATRDTDQYDLAVDLDNLLLTIDLQSARNDEELIATLTGPSGETTSTGLEPFAPGQLSAPLRPSGAGQYLLDVSNGTTSMRRYFLYRPASPDNAARTLPLTADTGQRINWFVVLALLGFLISLTSRASLGTLLRRDRERARSRPRRRSMDPAPRSHRLP